MTYGIGPGTNVAGAKGGTTARDEAFDIRWLSTTLLVGGLYLVGVLYSWSRGPSISLSFSAKVAFVFCPLAACAILSLGWSPRGFPITAAAFYGFLPLSQAASDTYVLWGDESVAAVTLEMALAVPLLITGWLGPRAPSGPLTRPNPSALTWVLWLFVAAGLFSSVVAESAELALPTFAARFLLPVLVTLGSLRRLHDIRDFKLIWLGYALGIAIVAVFNVQRIIFGGGLAFAAQVGQRWLGATGSYAIPTLLVAGPALWFGHALGLRKSPLHGLPWLGLAAVLGLLSWLGGHRGPTAFFALLVLWWIPGHPLRYLLSLRGLLSTALAGVGIAWLVTYFLSRTTADVTLTYERLREFEAHGLFSEARWFLWKEGLSYWLSSPICGIGPNNWVVRNQQFESAHSSVVALLYDVGLFGAAAFAAVVLSTLRISRGALLSGLSFVDREFYRGCRAGWVITLGLLAVNLPFTSGQAKNSVFAYVVFFFPLLAMLAHARHAPASPRAAVPSPFPLPATPVVMPTRHGPAPAP